MALSYHSNSRDPLSGSCDPQLVLTDSLIGFVYEQLQSPDFDIGSYLNPVPTTNHNAEPMPEQVLMLNSSHLTAPHMPSMPQDFYCTNAQTSCHQNVRFTPSSFVKYHQTCNNNQFGTTCLTNQVNFPYQNSDFPVRPYTGRVQGMVVPAFKSPTAQSVAARVRRKKISDKTQELAKLIPGGTHMNTAEMLLAAFKYVKFLQAQIGILAMMDLEEVILLFFVFLRVILSALLYFILPVICITFMALSYLLIY